MQSGQEFLLKSNPQSANLFHATLRPLWKFAAISNHSNAPAWHKSLSKATSALLRPKFHRAAALNITIRRRWRSALWPDIGILEQKTRFAGNRQNTNRGPARLYNGPRKTPFSKTPITSSARYFWNLCARSPFQNSTVAYRRGLKITVASGGMLTSIDAGRPWLSTASD